MERKDVHDYVVFVRERIAHWNKVLADTQAECEHPALYSVAKSDSGYCETWNWVEFDCPDCGKSWSEDR